MKGNIAAAVVASLSMVCCAAVFAAKGTIPDALAAIATTAVGGFLGVSIPSSSKMQ